MTNYNFIFNPETGKKVKSNGKVGLKILKKYLAQLGGASLVVQPDVNPINFSIQLDNFITKSKTKKANYWQYYIDKNPTDIAAYESYGKDHINTYKDDEFKLVDDNDINQLIPVVKQMYTRLQPDNTKYRVLKYLLPVESKVAYFGDYHSSLHALIDNLEDLKAKGFFKDGSWELNDGCHLIFTGDLVDRGPYGIECLYLLYLLFAINNAEKYRVFITNGNHEEYTKDINRGFYHELKYQFNSTNITQFNELIDMLPIAVFIKRVVNKLTIGTQWYQFCHGGIDESMHRDEIKNFLNDNSNNHDMCDKKGRGFMFSDFTSLDALGVFGNKNQRPGRKTRNESIAEGTLLDPGRGLIYSRGVTDRITTENNIKTIISGHQDMMSYGVILRGYSSKQELVWHDDDYSIKKATPLKTLAVIQNADPTLKGETTVDMNDFSATVMSSSTIAKMLQFSIYGVLDLDTDTSLIRWLPACNTGILLNRKTTKFNNNINGHC